MLWIKISITRVLERKEIHVCFVMMLKAKAKNSFSLSLFIDGQTVRISVLSGLWNGHRFLRSICFFQFPDRAVRKTFRLSNFDPQSPPRTKKKTKKKCCIRNKINVNLDNIINLGSLLSFSNLHICQWSLFEVE